jgi:alkylation response protein AidB-like acyl-CoA dehydrogenase
MLKRPSDQLSQPHAYCVERARRLVPLIAAAGPRIEQDGAIPVEIIDAMHAAGLFRLLIPRAYGGEEQAPIAYLAAVEEIAGADASTAWCMAQASGSSLLAGSLAPQVAREIFGDPRAAIASGPPGTPARAVAVDGGFRVTGAWPFASGITHATWLGAHCPVFESGGAPRLAADGKPLERTLLFPKASATIKPGWDVIGLRGTGSHSYAVSDLFVPEAYSVRRDSIADRREPGPLYRFPLLNIFGLSFAGVALGIARATLDAFVRLAAVKTARSTGLLLRDDPVVQAEMAVAEARLRAARAYLHETAGAAWDVAAQHDFTPAQAALMRLASTYVIQEARVVVEAAYRAAGSSAIFADQDFERRFRDMHTVSQQIQAHASNYQVAGAHLLGVRGGA